MSRRGLSFRVTLATGLLGAALLGGSPAFGQEAPIDRNAAVQKFQRGLELEQAQDWPGALQVFRDVGQYRMTPQVRFHIALCEAQLGKLVAALGGYELALQDAQSVGPDFANEVTTKVDELRARIPKMTIVRGQGAEAATISLDGVELGATRIGVEIMLDPGPHALMARAPGYEPYEETLVLGESDIREAVINLHSQDVASVDEPPPPPPPPPPDRGGSFPVGPVLVGGVGVALVATSAVLFAKRQELITDIDGSPCEDDCTNIGEPFVTKYKDLQTFSWAAPTTLGVGIAALAGAATWYFLDQPEKKKADADDADDADDMARRRIRLGVGAPRAIAGLSVSGTF